VLGGGGRTSWWVGGVGQVDGSGGSSFWARFEVAAWRRVRDAAVWCPCPVAWRGGSRAPHVCEVQVLKVGQEPRRAGREVVEPEREATEAVEAGQEWSRRRPHDVVMVEKKLA
jgi:hypothetical protein